jgi:hypothetical protein
MESSLSIEDSEKFRRSRKNRMITSVLNIIFHIASIIPIIIVLSIDRSSCTYPVRAWLIVYAAVSITGTFCSLLIEMLLNKDHFKRQLVSILYSIYYLTELLFFIAWTVLGSVWIYVDDSCKTGIL